MPGDAVVQRCDTITDRCVQLDEREEPDVRQLGDISVSNRTQVRPPFAAKNDPFDGAETGGAEPHIAEQSRSWRAASGEREVMRGS